jgi:CRP/FNR family cyclic AMP-dependent transcriptional regulator
MGFGMTNQSFSAGDTFWREGDPGSFALLLQSGTVEILDTHTAPPSVVATHGPGDVLGEIALIDERPRTHSAVARAPGQALFLTREAFQQTLLTDPRTCLPFLEALFKRLRHLEPRPPAVLPGSSGAVRPTAGWRLYLLPLSHHAAEFLPAEGLLIDRFPFRLGRAEEAHEKLPRSLNDFWLLDSPPFTVSRNHLTFRLDNGSRHMVEDCGSHLGTLVNEQKIGGKSLLKEVELDEGDNVIVLGGANSLFRFRAVLERISETP